MLWLKSLRLEDNNLNMTFQVKANGTLSSCCDIKYKQGLSTEHGLRLHREVRSGKQTYISCDKHTVSHHCSPVWPLRPSLTAFASLFSTWGKRGSWSLLQITSLLRVWFIRVQSTSHYSLLFSKESVVSSFPPAPLTWNQLHCPRAPGWSPQSESCSTEPEFLAGASLYLAQSLGEASLVSDPWKSRAVVIRKV